MAWHLLESLRLFSKDRRFILRDKKKACEPLHIQYSYDDQSVVVVNSYLKEFRGLKASVRILNFDLKIRFSEEVIFDIGPDDSKRVITIPYLQDLSSTYFVRLDLRDQEGKRLSTNFYWLSTVREVYDWEKSYFWATPMISFPDFRLLQTMPEIKLTARDKVTGRNSFLVTVQNPSDYLAFAVNVRLTSGDTGKELIPVLYEDNYFTLLPGEKREITATYIGRESLKEKPYIKVGGWNVK